MKVKELIAELVAISESESEVVSIGIGEDSRPITGVDGDGEHVFLYSPTWLTNDNP